MVPILPSTRSDIGVQYYPDNRGGASMAPSTLYRCAARVPVPTLLNLLQPSYTYSADAYDREAQLYLSTPKTSYMGIDEAVGDSVAAQAPRATFVPVVHSSDEELRSLNNSTPPHSPTKLKKASPTPSVRTVTTVDSLESLPSPFGERTHIPCSSSPSILSHSGEASGFRRVWIPPRDISVCHFLDSRKNYFDERNNKSLYSFDSPSKKSQLFSSSPGARDDDPMRKSRVKTELCMHYIKKTPCPFGSSCTYAHGEEELQLTKLMDLHRAGLADCETYRTKPCLTWVSTGSCPFGKRCAGIHDPRIAGDVQSWLPHTETQGNTIATDINVDALHQKRLETILYDNPFGSLASSCDDFESIYSLVCNTKNSAELKAKIKKPEVAEYHKLAIALQMRGESDFQYKFRPQHIIFDELCMVIQKRTFRLTRDGAIEVSVGTFSSHSAKDIVTVREIAFGPDCDPSIRGVGLWFNISEKEVTLCTPQQAKRYRWKSRGSLKQKDQEPNKILKSTLSSFDTRDSFNMIRPLDNDAYNLASAMLAHRLEVVLAERTAVLSVRSTALIELSNKRAALKTSFDNCMQHWKWWGWSVNVGRDGATDEDTPVPKVDDEYVPSTAKASNIEKQDNKAPVTAAIWKGFADTTFDEDEMADDSFEAEISDATSPGRLRVFQSLSSGSGCSHGKLPQINKSSLKKNDERIVSPVLLTATKAWKSLLLHPRGHGLSSNADWEIVRQHFQASRSRRVLSILQA